VGAAGLERFGAAQVGNGGHLARSRGADGLRRRVLRVGDLALPLRVMRKRIDSRPAGMEVSAGRFCIYCFLWKVELILTQFSAE
jgi:hypothetical protein